MKKTLFACAALGLLFAACKKKDDPVVTPKAPTKYEILTTGKWKMTAASTTMTMLGASNTTDMYAQMQDCEKDNLMIFGTDGKVTTDEGATKCDPSDPQTADAGTFALSNNDGTLTINDAGDVTNFNVTELATSSLKLKQDTTYSMSGVTVTVSTNMSFTK